MKKNNSFFLLIVLLFAGCHKPGHVTFPISDSFKSYCAFKTGTWWTFREMRSGRRDSMYVTSFDEQSTTHDETRFGTFTMNIASIADSFGTHNYNAIATGDVHNTSLLSETYHWGNGYGNSERFYFPIDTTFQNPGISIQHFDSLQFSRTGIIYHDVIMYSNNSSVENNWIKTEYYAKNIGVIRREMFNGETWELQDYYAVQ